MKSRPNRPNRPGRKPFRKPFQHKFKQRPEPIPARLHVILAREAPKAVIFRRGPSGRVCTLGWDLETDTFTMGQWLKGRIYALNRSASRRNRVQMTRVLAAAAKSTNNVTVKACKDENRLFRDT